MISRNLQKFSEMTKKESSLRDGIKFEIKQEEPLRIKSLEYLEKVFMNLLLLVKNTKDSSGNARNKIENEILFDSGFKSNNNWDNCQVLCSRCVYISKLLNNYELLYTSVKLHGLIEVAQGFHKNAI